MKRVFSKVLFLFAALLNGFNAQAQQYPFYFSSGDFNPPNSYSQSLAVKMGTVANTNIQVDTPTKVGNTYFRFFSGQSGGTIYEPAGDTDIKVGLATPFPLQVNSTINKAFYVVTSNTEDNYVFKTNGSGSPGNTNGAVIRVQGPIQSITGISQYPAGNVYAGQDVVVTAFLSDTFSRGQGAYLRYSLDGYNTSTVIPMTGSGKQYSATIPGSANTTGVTPNYYLFTSGDSLTIAPSDADLMTINLYNNNFANFTYTVQCDFTLGNTLFKMVQTDKARYNPGDAVRFKATFNDTVATGTLLVEYWHEGDSITEQTYSLTNATQYLWTWQTPNTDYQGYFAGVKLIQNGVTKDSTSIAVDVSSSWNKFPRYGFVSAYPYTDSLNRSLLFTRLNRYHLNGLQFYDVNHEHNKPLAGTVANPDTIWNDIANRPTYLSTVLAYIGLAHSMNMKAMDYNLLYGAYTSTATADSVLPKWGIYNDANHQSLDVYSLPSTWATSALQVENPGDTGWQNYFFHNESNLFQAIPYDGWHVDQLGAQGKVYDYYGDTVNLAATFGGYLQKAKTRLNVPLVMNAVTNYGQTGIATSPVEFLYTEVWPPDTGYTELVALIGSNSSYSNHTLATVLAAYINMGISNSPGVFNPAAVLLADATIFAAGGSHIEQGDHLLCNPYFPNSNLTTPCGLQEQLIKYYDFLVGYQNLLRDSVSASPVTLQTSGTNALSTTATTGKIWVLSRLKGNTQIFHLINLVSANTLSWNDPNDNQAVPTIITNIPLSFATDSIITKVVVASPDWNNGLPVSIPFTQTGGTVSFTVPYLSYWTMVTAKTGQINTGIKENTITQNVSVYPNPFSELVNFKIELNTPARVTLILMNDLGQVVYQSHIELTGGTQNINVPSPSQATGIYFWSADILNDGQTGHETKYGKLVKL